MEGVALSQLNCLNLIKELNINSDKIILFGGSAKSSIWRQIIADVLNSRVVTLNIEEGPAFGAAVIAGAGFCIYHNIEEGINKTINEDEENNPIAENVEKYTKIYQIYKSLYINLKDNFKKLSSL